MWQQEPTDDFQRQLRWFEKKRPRELAAVLVNLQTYLTALNAGSQPLQIGYRFIHPEGHGVVAIDQKGGGKSLAETRLYAYPDAVERILYLLTIGDKNSQRADVLQCHEYAAQLRNRKPVKDDPAKGTPNEGGETQAL